MRFVIQKLGREVKTIVVKFRSDQTINLRIGNEKQGFTAGEILSRFLPVSPIYNLSQY